MNLFRNTPCLDRETSHQHRLTSLKKGCSLIKDFYFCCWSSCALKVKNNNKKSSCLKMRQPKPFPPPAQSRHPSGYLAAVGDIKTRNTRGEEGGNGTSVAILSNTNKERQTWIKYCQIQREKYQSPARTSKFPSYTFFFNFVVLPEVWTSSRKITIHLSLRSIYLVLPTQPLPDRFKYSLFRKSCVTWRHNWQTCEIHSSDTNHDAAYCKTRAALLCFGKSPLEWVGEPDYFRCRTWTLRMVCNLLNQAVPSWMYRGRFVSLQRSIFMSRYGFHSACRWVVGECRRRKRTNRRRQGGAVFRGRWWWCWSMFSLVFIHHQVGHFDPAVTREGWFRHFFSFKLGSIFKFWFSGIFICPRNWSFDCVSLKHQLVNCSVPPWKGFRRSGLGLSLDLVGTSEFSWKIRFCKFGRKMWFFKFSGKIGFLKCSWIKWFCEFRWVGEGSGWGGWHLWSLLALQNNGSSKNPPTLLDSFPEMQVDELLLQSSNITWTQWACTWRWRIWSRHRWWSKIQWTDQKCPQSDQGLPLLSPVSVFKELYFLINWRSKKFEISKSFFKVSNTMIFTHCIKVFLCKSSTFISFSISSKVALLK